MQKAISNSERYIQYERPHAKAPIWPIIVTTPLELLHMDFTSIEMMMELDQPQTWWTFGFCDHFPKHTMVYMTPDQTAKTVAKFLW